MLIAILTVVFFAAICLIGKFIDKRVKGQPDAKVEDTFVSMCD